MKIPEGLEGLIWPGGRTPDKVERVLEVMYSSEVINFDRLKNQIPEGYTFATAPEMYAFLKQISKNIDGDEKCWLQAHSFREKLKPREGSITRIHTNTIVKYDSFGGALLKHSHYPYEVRIFDQNLVNPMDAGTVVNENLHSASQHFIKKIFDTEDNITEIETVLKKVSGYERVVLYTASFSLEEHPLRPVTFSRSGEGLCIGTPSYHESKGFVPMVRI